MSVLTQSGTRLGNSGGKIISLAVHVLRNTSLATGEADGSQDSGVNPTVRILEGEAHIKVSWADFTRKPEGFNREA